MSLSLNFDFKKYTNSEWINQETRQKGWKNFIKTIESEEIGFFRVNKRKELYTSCLEVFEKFQRRTHFIQVGIGGSSLGPEMLVSALSNHKRSFSFINNIDPDQIAYQLNSINHSDALFYFVSKSGSTAETMAGLSIITNWLLEKGVKENHLSNYFVFATDPGKSQLKDLGQKLGITCLEVPSDVGGRFSVLTPVGLLPALFAGIDCEELLNGVEDYKTTLLNSNLDENILMNSTCALLSLGDTGINQTVLMPYSSRLRDLSFWFVQLWAESLGKITKEGKHVGFTPIPSYGATDQHSQVQLFMEGPYDKFIFFLEVEKFENDFSLQCPFQTPSLEKLAPYKLSQLIKAELYGTLKAMEENNRPLAHLKIDRLNAYNLGQLLIFFESLTALTGIMLNINPFDQPGVEAGKRYAFDWLERA